MGDSRWLRLTPILFVLLPFGIAKADDSAFCQKAHARTAADASLLLGPSVKILGIKYPSNGISDAAGIVTGQGYQLRAELSWSPLDFYKGLRLLGTARLACAEHDLSQQIERALLVGDDLMRLPALRKQVAALDATQAERDQLIAKAEERLAAHVTPLLETNELRTHAAEINRRAAELRADLKRMEAAGIEEIDATVIKEVGAAERASMETERAQAHMRTLDAWDIGVTGGIVPMVGAFDLYGVAHVGFNFGGIGRHIHEAKYLKARESELKHAVYELTDKAQKFHAQQREAARQARHELALLNRQISTFTTAREVLRAADASQQPHALAMVELELMGLLADKVYFTALIERLETFEGEHA